MGDVAQRFARHRVSGDVIGAEFRIHATAEVAVAIGAHLEVAVRYLETHIDELIGLAQPERVAKDAAE